MTFIKRTRIRCCGSDCVSELTYHRIIKEYAFNIALCVKCGNVYKENFGKNKGIVVLTLENNLKGVTIKKKGYKLYDIT